MISETIIISCLLD